MPLPDPFEADLSTFWQPWMAYGAENGLVALYHHGDPPVNYPPLFLGLLVALGVLYRQVEPAMSASPLQSVLIKLPAVVADLLIAVLLYQAGRRILASWPCWSQDAAKGQKVLSGKGAPQPLTSRLPFLMAAVWALNPAVIYVSAYWGQVDSIPTLWMVAALLASLDRHWGWAGTLMALALLTKLQAVILLPLLLLLAWLTGPRALLRGGAGLLGTLVLGLLPFAAGDALVQVLTSYSSAVGFYEGLTLGAYNLWWPLHFFSKRFLDLQLTDDLILFGPLSLRWLAVGLLAAYAALLLWALMRWHQSRNQETSQKVARAIAQPVGSMTDELTAAFFAAGMLVFGFFMLPTEIHERYILPALAFLAPVAWQQRGLVIAYLLLSGSVFLNLIEVLPFAPWLYRLLSALPAERLFLALVNLILFAYLTHRYLRATRPSSPLPGSLPLSVENT
jgi:hypothetical protein